jgi:hypothetical protein
MLAVRSVPSNTAVLTGNASAKLARTSGAGLSSPAVLSKLLRDQKGGKLDEICAKPLRTGYNAARQEQDPGTQPGAVRLSIIHIERHRRGRL